MKTGRYWGSGQAAALSVLALILLGACSEREAILPGERENVRSVLQTAALAALPEEDIIPENTTRPISLGPPRDNGAWSQSSGTSAQRVSHAAFGRNPQLLWSANIGQGDSRRLRITADPVVADQRIFTLDAGAQVVATSVAGARLWAKDLTPQTDAPGQGTGGGLALEGDTLYVSVGYGVLYALEAATGVIKWHQNLEASGSGRPTVFGDFVYLVAGDSSAWAVRKSDGRVQWKVAAALDRNNVLGAPAPALTDQLAIFGYGSGQIKAVLRRSGVARWGSDVLGRRPGRALASINDVTGSPVVDRDRVYAGNQSGRLSALDLTSAAPIWTAREGAFGAVWPVGGSVFLMTDLNELVRLDARNGRRIWGVPLPNFVKERPRRKSEIFTHHGPIVAGGRLIVASSDGFLRSFDPRDGTLISAIDIPSGATTAPVVAGGTLYVVSRNGQLHAFR
ncbi:MAG: PQQ-binding-like beta-propeller repeat protein [Pseudomonadota bacterium]